MNTTARRLSLGIVALAAALSGGAALQALAANPALPIGLDKVAFLRHEVGEASFAQPVQQASHVGIDVAALETALSAHAIVPGQGPYSLRYATAQRGLTASLQDASGALSAQAQLSPSLVDAATLGNALASGSSPAALSSPTRGYGAALGAVLPAARPDTGALSSPSAFNGAVAGLPELANALSGKSAAFSQVIAPSGYGAPLQAALTRPTVTDSQLSATRSSAVSVVDLASLARALRGAE
jgi:hypothetical protein